MFLRYLPVERAPSDFPGMLLWKRTWKSAVFQLIFWYMSSFFFGGGLSYPQLAITRLLSSYPQLAIYMFNVIQIDKIDQFIIRPAQKPNSAHRSIRVHHCRVTVVVTVVAPLERTSRLFPALARSWPALNARYARFNEAMRNRNENPVLEKPKLLGGWALALWKMMEWKSVGMMTFPIWWGK